MMTTPIFFNAVLQEKIWGGTKLHSLFNFTLPSDKTGEAWIISAHPNGISTIKSPAEYAGLGLDELYKTHPELFNGQQLASFPVLIKLLDASDDLSIQVHPDDEYALEHEGEYGKNECWYVVQAEPGAKIVYGHTAMTPEEFSEQIDNEAWSELFTEVTVKAGDFFDVPSGTIHAIGGGIVILETQQNSDTTYRVYDYNRTDDAGNPRPLHIQQTKDVTTIPHQMGAIIRTAECVGATAVLIPKRHNAPINATVAKTSAGAIEQIPLVQVGNVAQTIKQLQKQGFWVMGAHMEGDRTLYEADMTIPTVIVIGNEGKGISRVVKEACDFLVTIPMYGNLNSLNASVAAAVLMYEAVRQRQAK